MSKPRKTPARRPAKKTTGRKTAVSKTPAKEPEKTPEPVVMLVRPLAPNALKLALDLIDNATIKGSDAQLVIALKVELARVAGAKASGQ